MDSWKLALVTALVVASLGIAAAPSRADTTVTGHQDLGDPLVISPSSEPFDAPLRLSAAPLAVAFIQKMPVSKRIDEVTVGEFARGAGCSGDPGVKLRIQEHLSPTGSNLGANLEDDALPGSSSTNSTNTVSIDATMARRAWTIPPFTLHAGHGYSFNLYTVAGSPCTDVQQRTWAREGQVNPGPARCARGMPFDEWSAIGGIKQRVWHTDNAPDSQPGCSGNWSSSMPTGWLAGTYSSGSLRIHIAQVEEGQDPGSACPQRSELTSRGARGEFWQENQFVPELDDYVCTFGVFGDYGQTVPDGWHYGLPWRSDTTTKAREAYLKLETIDSDGRLEAHRPTWAFDDDETFFPQEASAFTDHWQGGPNGEYVNDPLSRNTLYSEGPVELAAAGSPGPDSELPGCPCPHRLFLGLLGERYGFGSHGPSSPSDWIAALGSDEATYAASAQEMYAKGHDDIVYGRPVLDPDDGRLWLQYWTFYYYNGWSAFTLGEHAGDWEMIQVGLDAQGGPELVTFAKHNGAVGCDWPDIDHEGPSDNSPVVYVAAESHASYDFAGTSGLPGATDRHRGNKFSSTLPMENIDGNATWPTWRGKWGQHGGSPMNPSEQGDKWSKPSKFHDDHEDQDGC
jgi:hypothetical protein